jgi:hypothetical protein
VVRCWPWECCALTTTAIANQPASAADTVNESFILAMITVLPEKGLLAVYRQ